MVVSTLKSVLYCKQCATFGSFLWKKYPNKGIHGGQKPEQMNPIRVKQHEAIAKSLTQRVISHFKSF